MVKKKDWSTFDHIKIIDEKGLEKFLKSKAGELTLQDVLDEVGLQALVLIKYWTEVKKYIIEQSDPATTNLIWIHNPKLFKQLMKHAVPAPIVRKKVG